VAKGAYRRLVLDQLEQTGMRWTVEEAQAMLHVRELYINGQWGEFIEFRSERNRRTCSSRSVVDHWANGASKPKP
jgi:hypothetical protein